MVRNGACVPVTEQRIRCRHSTCVWHTESGNVYMSAGDLD